MRSIRTGPTARCPALVLAGLMTLFPAGGAAAATEPGAPRIEVEAYEIDLGTISRGDTVEARFLLRNAGERDLRILEVNPG